MTPQDEALARIEPLVEWRSWAAIASQPWHEERRLIDFDPVLMIKLLFLGRFHGYGDNTLLELVRDRPAAMAFLGATGGEVALPSSRQLGEFREKLRAARLHDAVLGGIEARLSKEGIQLPRRERPGGQTETRRIPASSSDPDLSQIVQREQLDRIPDLEVARLIARGAMSAVYEAIRTPTKTRVALKVLHQVHRSDDVIARFITEMRVLGALDHPGVVRFLESGAYETDRGMRPYILMEYVDGRLLRTYLDTERPSFRRRVELLLGVAEAVSHVHERGIVHRDLKPQNILVDAEGRPRILDFGLARATREMTPPGFKTGTGQLVGTFDYMSPEGSEARPELIDARTDVYGMGVLAYDVLSGRPPFNFRGKVLPTILEMIQKERPAPLGSVVPACAGVIEGIVARCLEKRKEDRYPDAKSLAEAWRGALTELPGETEEPDAATSESRC